MKSPADLDAIILRTLVNHAYDLYGAACHATFDTDPNWEWRAKVCEAGALVARTLGITAGLAAFDPPSVPLVSDAEETLDLPADPSEFDQLRDLVLAWVDATDAWDASSPADPARFNRAADDLVRAQHSLRRAVGRHLPTAEAPHPRKTET